MYVKKKWQKENNFNVSLEENNHHDKNAKILHLEELICDSHTQEKLHDEEIAVTKIKTDPNYFFIYAKKA